MKKAYIKILGLIILIAMVGLIFTLFQGSKKYKFKISAKELHSELVKKDYFIDPNKAMEMLSKETNDYIFVDIRNPREYDNFHIENAVNVPMSRILDDEFIPYLKNEKTKVLYSDESIEAVQIRLLLSQYGYKNLYVLQGGANYWKEHMLSNDVFKAKGEYDDEKLKFDINTIKGSN